MNTTILMYWVMVSLVIGISNTYLILRELRRRTETNRKKSGDA